METTQNHELRKLEYETLNREILDYSTKVYQVVTICAGGVAAILSYTLNADVSKFPLGASFFPFALLVLPFLVILPGILLVESSLRTTARIAGYLFVFHEEGREGLRWQHAVQLYREDQKGKRRRTFRRALVYVFSSLACGSLGCSAFAAWIVPTLGSKPVQTGLLFHVLFAVAISVVALSYFTMIRRIDKFWSVQAFEKEEVIFRRVKGKVDAFPGSGN